MTNLTEPTPPPDGLIYLTDLQPQPIDWLWPQRLAAGTLALLSGQPGAGKTWLALALAANLSRGRAPYTGDTLPPCTTLYASAEHPPAQIVHPRFAALRGDPARLAVFHPAPTQPEQLDQALQRTQARLLILDPLDTFFGPTFESARLEPLLHLAEHHRCCILLLRHLRKPGPGRPPQRALAPTAAFRSEFLAGASPDAPAQPALLHIKSNLGPLAPSLSYSIDPTGDFHFTGLSALTPQELLADRPTGAGLPKRKFVGQWLRQQLQQGSQTQHSLEIAAHRDGICIATLKRAKFDLGVISTKEGITGRWFWSLPQPIEQQNK